MSARQAPDRNIAMELVRVTEAGAMAAARWIGRGEKESADQAAVDAMRFVLDSVAMRGVVVIGEGEKDEAPMLYNGEEVGSGEGAEVDVAVDPLEGTRLTALGQPGAIAVIAVAERGTMLFPGAAFYMEKIAVGPRAVDAIDITRSPTENVARVAEALGKTAREVDVVVLERDRHAELIAELRDCGRAREADPRRRRRAGDRSRAARHGRRHPLRHRRDAGGHHLRGGIEMRRRRHPGAAAGRATTRERKQLVAEGLDPERVLHTNDLVRGDDVFVAATGVTNGPLLSGVQYVPGRRGHRLDRHALALGDGAAHQRAAVDREALRPHGLRIPVSRRRSLAGNAVAARCATRSWTSSSMRRTVTARSAVRRPARRSSRSPASSARSSG